jgi:hypothetical protein
MDRSWICWIGSRANYVRASFMGINENDYFFFRIRQLIHDIMKKAALAQG